MEKEMMDKINEVLKANGKRELSMDEMDKVSDGVCIMEYNQRLWRRNDSS